MNLDKIPIEKTCEPTRPSKDNRYECGIACGTVSAPGSKDGNTEVRTQKGPKTNVTQGTTITTLKPYQPTNKTTAPTARPQRGSTAHPFRGGTRGGAQRGGGGRRIFAPFNYDIPTGQDNRTYFEKFYVLKVPRADLSRDVDIVNLEKQLETQLGVRGADVEAPKIRRANKSSMMVEVMSETQGRKLQGVKELVNRTVIVEKHKTMNYVKGTNNSQVLFNTPIEDIKEALKDQGVVDVERMKVRRGGQLTETRRHIFTFKRMSLPPTIKITKWHTETIEPYIPKPYRCLRCQKLGHIQKRCNSKTGEACAQCGMGDHKMGDCRNRPHCVNCEGEHRSGDRSCPAYLFKCEVLATQARQHIMYWEAEEITRQRQRMDGITYSSVLARGAQKHPTEKESQRTENKPLAKTTATQTEEGFEEELTAPKVLLSRPHPANSQLKKGTITSLSGGANSAEKRRKPTPALKSPSSLTNWNREAQRRDAERNTENPRPRETTAGPANPAEGRESPRDPTPPPPAPFGGEAGGGVTRENSEAGKVKTTVKVFEGGRPGTFKIPKISPRADERERGRIGENRTRSVSFSGRIDTRPSNQGKLQPQTPTTSEWKTVGGRGGEAGKRKRQPASPQQTNLTPKKRCEDKQNEIKTRNSFSPLEECGGEGEPSGLQRIGVQIGGGSRARARSTSSWGEKTGDPPQSF